MRNYTYIFIILLAILLFSCSNNNPVKPPDNTSSKDTLLVTFDSVWSYSYGDTSNVICGIWVGDTTIKKVSLVYTMETTDTSSSSYVLGYVICNMLQKTTNNWDTMFDTVYYGKNCNGTKTDTVNVNYWTDHRTLGIQFEVLNHYPPGNHYVKMKNMKVYAIY